MGRHEHGLFSVAEGFIIVYKQEITPRLRVPTLYPLYIYSQVWHHLDIFSRTILLLFVHDLEFISYIDFPIHLFAHYILST
jgi:hypothetical protein